MSLEKKRAGSKILRHDFTEAQISFMNKIRLNGALSYGLIGYVDDVTRVKIVPTFSAPITKALFMEMEGIKISDLADDLLSRASS